MRVFTIGANTSAPDPKLFSQSPIAVTQRTSAKESYVHEHEIWITKKTRNKTRKAGNATTALRMYPQRSAFNPDSSSRI